MGIKRIKNTGFTLVELVVIISVIGILASISIVGYGAWQKRTIVNVIKSDLTSAASALESARNFNNGYPTSLPSTFKPSVDTVLEMTTTNPGQYCINAYSLRDTTIRMSIYSVEGKNARDYLCTGVTSGPVLGGQIPATPKGVNIAPSFASWTLAGGATYNASTGELALGVNGTALSPKIRATGVNGVRVDAQFYATTQSAYAAFQPKSGWLSGSYYYAADGISPGTNTGGYTGNGCARQVTLNSWNTSANGDCTFGLGNNVVYFSIILTGSSGGYASPELKMKNMTFIAY